MKNRLAIAVLVGIATTPLAVAAQTAPASAAQQERAEPVEIATNGLVAMLSGTTKPEDYFSENFIAAVPAAQITQIADTLKTQFGQPLSAEITEKLGPTRAKIAVNYESGVVHMDIAASTSAPIRATGLLITGSEVKSDSLAKISEEFAALPGDAGYVVAKLPTSGAPEILAERNIAKQFAIGSTFKLYILAELASQIEAGERSWADVTTLAHRSFSSQATKRWPDNTPMTLQTLANMMISTSDNSATDTLLHLLGREKVEARLAEIGHDAPDKALPFLSTVEAFAIKSNDAMHSKFAAASEAKQRAMLAREAEWLGYDDVDESAFANGPRFIDSIEWFASPTDMAKLLDYLRNMRNDRMLEIMAINSGIGDSDSAKWNYLGYKGGSEPGVISLSYLAHSKSGAWYAISASWNNKDNPVDETKFVGLMTRLLNNFANQ